MFTSVKLFCPNNHPSQSKYDSLLTCFSLQNWGTIIIIIVFVQQCNSTGHLKLMLKGSATLHWLAFLFEQLRFCFSKWTRVLSFYDLFSAELIIKWHWQILACIYFVSFFTTSALCLLCGPLRPLQRRVYRFCSIHDTSSYDSGQDSGIVSPLQLGASENCPSRWTLKTFELVLFPIYLTESYQ